MSNVKKVKKYDAQGREIIDDDETLRDGQRIRNPMLLMDGKTPVQPEPPKHLTPHLDNRPGPVAVRLGTAITDADRERRQKLVQDYDTRISDAWKDAGIAKEDE